MKTSRYYATKSARCDLIIWVSGTLILGIFLHTPSCVGDPRKSGGAAAFVASKTSVLAARRRPTLKTRGPPMPDSRCQTPLYLYPLAGGPQSILDGASCGSLGHGVGCGLVFCVAFGFGYSAFAAVSFSLFAGSRSVLVPPPAWWWVR